MSIDDGLQQLGELIERYEKRARDNRSGGKVEVHIPIDDLEILLRLARVTFTLYREKRR